MKSSYKSPHTAWYTLVDAPLMTTSIGSGANQSSARAPFRPITRYE